MSRVLAVCLVLASTGVMPLSTRAEDPALVPPTPGERELARMSGALEQIASLLRQNLERQQVASLIARIDLRLRTLAPLESELRNLRDERERLETVVTDIQAEAVREEELRRDGDREPAEIERLRRVRDTEIARIRARVQRVELRITELEADLARGRRQIQAWEDIVDERLGLR